MTQALARAGRGALETALQSVPEQHQDEARAKAEDAFRKQEKAATAEAERWPTSMDNGGARAGFTGGPRYPFGQGYLPSQFGAAPHPFLLSIMTHPQSLQLPRLLVGSHTIRVDPMTVLNRPVGEGAAGGKLATGWHPPSARGGAPPPPRGVHASLCTCPLWGATADLRAAPLGGRPRHARGGSRRRRSAVLSAVTRA